MSHKCFDGSILFQYSLYASVQRTSKPRSSLLPAISATSAVFEDASLLVLGSSAQRDGSSYDVSFDTK